MPIPNTESATPSREGRGEEMKLSTQAVSPVIATVLLLAITVLLTSMVFIMMQGAFDNLEKQPPSGAISVRSLDNGYHVIRFSSLDQHLDPDHLEFQLIPPDGVCPTAGECTGMASDADVYGKIGSNVTFFDRDAGFTVSEGDYFVIDSRSLGSDEGDWTFRLFYSSTNSVIATVTLPVIPA